VRLTVRKLWTETSPRSPTDPVATNPPTNQYRFRRLQYPTSSPSPEVIVQKSPQSLKPFHPLTANQANDARKTTNPSLNIARCLIPRWLYSSSSSMPLCEIVIQNSFLQVFMNLAVASSMVCCECLPTRSFMYPFILRVPIRHRRCIPVEAELRVRWVPQPATWQ
jgi:hypothetical protein